MEEIRIYNTLDSTNVEAQRLLTNPSIIAHGTTLVAYSQTGGKGQFGRTWHTEPGQHLAMTVILKPENAPVSDLPRFSKLISLAICHVLEKTDAVLQPKIKWPNDIYVNDKKAAGILIENALSGNRIQHIIAGIGINVNETQFPPELSNAVSLRMITGKEYDIIELVKGIREKILEYTAMEPRGSEGQAGDVLSGVEAGTNFSPLNEINIQSEKIEGYSFEGSNAEKYYQEFEDIFKQSLYKLNQSVEFNNEGTLLEGIVTDVDDQGRLVLNVNGELQSFYTHELKWII